MARVIEFYIPQDFKTDGAMGAAGSTRKGSRVPQHCSEEVSLNCSEAKGELRGSQGRRCGAC